MGRIRLRSSRLFLRVLPVLVWLAAVAGVVGMFQHRAGQFEIVGIADAEVHDVGTNIRARLISVQVQLFSKVNKGDPVAVVNTLADDERIEAQKAVIKAEINHLDAQLKEMRKHYEALVFNQESEWWAERRAFTADVVAATARVVDTNAIVENDQATLKELQQEIDIFRIENGANFAADVSLYNKMKTMKRNHDRLAEKIERDKGLLATYKEELEKAKIREKKYVTYRPYAGTDPNESQRVIFLAKEALERQLDELEERQREIVLTAPCDGFVSSIDSQIGEVVILPDFPVLSITEEKPSSIIAYVNENLAGHFTASKEVEIVKGSEPKQIGKSEITYIGPRVEQLPTRLWRNPAVPQWGRLMQIEIPLGMKLIPGELVGIRIL
jgi:multidrug efflux pump subunit AcrA (membrane-fusion protein)